MDHKSQFQSSSSQTGKKNLHFSVHKPNDNIEYILLVMF